jgi:hypothetical protein
MSRFPAHLRSAMDNDLELQLHKHSTKYKNGLSGHAVTPIQVFGDENLIANISSPGTGLLTS